MALNRTRPFLALAALLALFPACSSDKTPDMTVDGKAPRVVTFTLSADTVARGGKVTISWMVENAGSISITASPGGPVIETSPMLSGSIESAAIQADTQFTLKATGDAGRSAEATKTVTVDLAAVSIQDFAARPNPGPRNGKTQLAWTTLGATQVRVLEGTRQLLSAPPSEVASGTLLVDLTQPSHTFTLVAANDSNSVMSQVTVAAELPPEIRNFRITPTAFSGSSAQISITWTTLNASTVTLTANEMPVAGFPPNTATGTITVTASDTALYQLTAKSGGGEERAIQLVAKTVAETEPNDTFQTATRLMTGGATGEISPETDVDFYSVTVAADGWILAETSDGAGDCALDTVLTLIAPDGTTELGSNDQGGTGDCSRIDPVFDEWAASLDAGTYFIRVESFLASVAGPYTLAVVTGTKRCGNGIYEEGEQCDDGNTASGDDCSGTCQREVVGTISPPSGMVDVDLVGLDDIAFVQVNIATAGQSITATTADAAGGCTIDTAIYLVDSQNIVLGATFDNGEDSPCATLRFPADDFATDLEPGTYFIVLLNESEASGKVRLSASVLSPRCGNSLVERNGGEQCDDGNSIDNDGCSPTCRAQAVGALSGTPASMTFTNAIDPAGQQDLFQITMTEEGYISAETFVPDVGQCAGGADTKLDLLDSNFMELGGDDDGGLEFCSKINASEDYARVMPGTYFVRVYAFNPDAIISAYALTIRTFRIGCGNGVVEMNETCDDGNTTSGDNCSATCQFEGPTEAEPNDTAASANSISAGTITAAGLPQSDTDFFRIQIPAGNHLVAFATEGGFDSCSGPRLGLTLYAPDGTTVLAQDSSGGPDANCGRIAPDTSTSAIGLAAGTYYLQVTNESFSQDPVSSYFIHASLLTPGCPNGVLDAGEQCDDGNSAAGDGCSAACRFEGNVTAESEANNDQASADASMATLGQTVTVQGSIDPLMDADFWSFVVPSGPNATLIAQTYTRIGDTNECVAADTKIVLFNSSGMMLTEDDDGGPGFCSLVDGTLTPEASNLAPGTYYISVRHYNDTQAIANYFMNIRLQ